MIQTLEELIAQSERVAAAAEARGFPEIADETRLRTPGCSEEELARIRAALPGMPESYLEVAARIALPNISIGYLELAPGGLYDGSLFDRLTDKNSSAWPLWEVVNQHNLYHVADTDGALFCVAGEGTRYPGEVFEVDYEWGGINDPQLRRVAWSFMQMMLGFGRISEQCFAEREGPEVVEEVLSSLRTDFGLDDEHMEVWSEFVEEALGGEVDRDEASTEFGGVTNLQLERTKSELLDYDADVDSEIPPFVRNSASKHFPTIPNWPHWQVDEFTYVGLRVRHYWTKYEGQAYMLRQGYRGNPNPVDGVYNCFEPKVWIFVRRGWPRLSPVKNWTMHDVANYSLPGIELGQEAPAEVAAFRRHLPELLAELEAKGK